MKKNQIRKSVAALAMAAVVSVSLLGYGCGSKPASSTAGVSGEFTGTAKGMGGDVTVTLTLTDGKITASGGRVLNVTARGDSLGAARDAAYAMVDQIDWPEGFCRRDIGWRAL